MIKNAVLHLLGEQPLIADLLLPPQATDVSLLCTNLRTMDGKRPTSIDEPSALFILPMATIRFIEAPPEALEAVRSAATAPGRASRRAAAKAAHNGNGQASENPELPERAVIALPGGELHGLLPDSDEEQLFDEDEPDEELLRRIRDA